jgi:hypothetical protein
MERLFARIQSAVTGGPAQQFFTLLIVNLAFYATALGRHFFWWDDITLLISAHRGVHSWADLQQGHFIPAFRLWAIGELHLFGVHSAPYQVVSILLMTVVCFLFVRLLSRAGVSGLAASLAAAVFAASPINSENVVWFTMQTEILMALFFLAALLLLPDHPIAAALALFMSFGSFGAGPLLLAPFCLYCLLAYDRLLFKPLAFGTIAAAVFAGMRIASRAPVTHFAHPFTEVRLWPSAIFLGFRSLASLNNINRWMPAAGILGAVLLAKPRLIPWRKNLVLLVPVSLAFTFMLAAYWFRGSVEKRHLMMPLLGVLWLTTAALCSGRVSRLRSTFAVAVLAAFLFYPFWLHAQQEIQVRWYTISRAGQRYTEDLRQLLEHRKPIYDTHLIQQLNPYHRISEYARLMVNSAPVVEDPFLLEFPRLFDSPALRAGLNADLSAWLAQNPDPQTRDFYARYYSLSPVPPQPTILPDQYAGTALGCAIDGINGTLQNPLEISRRQSPAVQVDGWAVDSSVGLLPARVFVSLDDHMNFPTFVGTLRLDISNFFHNERFRKCGLVAFLTAASIPDGSHVLSLKIVSHDGSKYWTCAHGAPRVIHVVR